MKKTSNTMQMAFLSRAGSTIVKLLVCIGLFTSIAAFGATTLTWTGADINTPTELGDSTNWSGGVLPSPTAGDLAQWDGSVSGNLSLTYTTGLGGSSGDQGVNYVLTASQAGDVTIDSSSGNTIRFNNFTNNSSSAAFTLGSSSGNINLVLGGTGGSTQTWINNSSATATIGADVQFNMGGGGGHNFILGGTGNWTINTYIANINTGGAPNIVKNNVGTLILNPSGGTLGAGPAGDTTINTGTLQVQSSYAFAGGSTPTTSVDGFQYGGVTVNTNGLLDLNGFSVNINALNGSLGTIDTVAGGTVTLTVGANGNNGSSFSGVIQNSAGSIALVVAGTSTLALSGTNTYTGGTTVSAGTLMVNGTIAGNVTVASGASFGGTGTIPGTVNWSSGSTLTLVPNQPLNLTGNATLNNNAVVVNVPGISPLAAGTYTLMTYTPANVTGSLNATPTFTGAGAVPGTYTISISGGMVTLTVTSSVTVGSWTNSISGNWSITANWNGGVPNLAKDTAILGVAPAFTTVTLDVPEAIGVLNFTNANSFAIADAGNTLTLDNSGNGATINVSGGTSNLIGAPVFLNDNVTVTITPFNGYVLSLTNVVSGASGKTLTVANGGTLGLYANNTYGPSAGSIGTTISAGTLLFGNAHAIGAGDLNVSGSSTIQFGAPMALANNIQISPSATLSVNDGGNAVTLGGAVAGGGSVTEAGTGTTTISSIGTLNTMRVNSGTLVLAASGANYTNLYSAGTNSYMEIASASGTVNILGGLGGPFVDNGGTLQIDSGATVNCLTIGATGYIGAGNTTGSTNKPATLNVYGNIYNIGSFLIARHGFAVMNMYSGVCSNNAFFLGQNEGYAVVNLNGGTLWTGNFNSQPSTTNNQLNFNGGTVKAHATTSSGFFNNYSAALNVYVRNAGGTIDNNGINIRIQQPFLHSAISGDNAIDGGMTFKGTGTNLLSGVTETYTGNTIIAAGTMELTNSIFNPASTISISNGAVLLLDNSVTNAIGGLILNGVSQPGGVYNNGNAPSYIMGAGSLLVVPTGPVAPTNSPTVTQFSLSNVGPSGGDVVISGTNGNVGATYYLLRSTNVATPLAQWKTVATNVASGNSFTFTGTNAVTSGAAQQFYILSSTNYNP